MGKVVVTEFISLDGVIEDPGGAEDYAHGGWSFKFDRGAEGDAFKMEELQASDAQLLGRVTYEGFAKAWPSMGDNPFGEKMNSMPKYVVSSTMSPQDATWENSTVIGGVRFAEEVDELKGRYAGDILVAGSAQLAHSLTAAGLVDEYRLMVFPIVLGAGKRLFAESDAAIRLRLLESRPLGSDGVMLLTYAPDAEADGAPVEAPAQ